jgi:hypothetical protein
MRAIEQLAQVERRGRALRLFVARVRERGGVAQVEEEIDLPRLRGLWRTLRQKAFGVARLDELGPTPIDEARLQALRRQVASNGARRRRGLR